MLAAAHPAPVTGGILTNILDRQFLCKLIGKCEFVCCPVCVIEFIEADWTWDDNCAWKMAS